MSIVYFGYIVCVWLIATAAHHIIDLTKPSRLTRITSYVRLVRLMYHSSFIIVLFGALYNHTFLPGTAQRFAFLYIFFNVCLYGGIYTMNQLTDLDSDRAHSRKKHRPVASGEVSPRNAWAFVLLLWAIGFTGAYWLHGIPLVLVFSLFLTINLFYSTFAKEVPVLDILTNTATYPLRCYMGALVADNPVSTEVIGAVFCLGLLMTVSKRILETRVLGWESRSTLKTTGPVTLHVIFLFAFLIPIALASQHRHDHSTLLFARILSLSIIVVHGTMPASAMNTTFLLVGLAVVNSVCVPYAYETKRMSFVVDSVLAYVSVVILTVFCRGGIMGVLDKAHTY
eukprot:c2263_g1_i1.p1 GENE.c2263_g1_i1~~c2263_g1_i1.p1  ORF type:complete len:384 (+),score=63.00 c2263_g1_i1:133-1152(+)